MRDKANMGSSFVVSYVFEILGILPSSGAPFISATQGFVVKLATPLLLLSADFRKILRETGDMLKAFLIGSFGTLLGATIGYLLLHKQLVGIGLSSENWKLAAALTAKNIGGGLNYMVLKLSYRSVLHFCCFHFNTCIYVFQAVADVFDISDRTVGLGLAVDNLLGIIYFPFISWLGILLK